MIKYSQVDDIAFLTMDDGKVNAISPSMCTALNGGLDRAAGDADAIVITGRTNVFCGGFDLNIIRGEDEILKSRMRQSGMELLKRLYLLPQPIIFAVTGHAIAMGALLLLAGDLRIALDGKYRIGLNETSIGLSLPVTGLEMARDRLAPTIFQRATINSELFSPKNAITAGYLDEVAVGLANFDALVLRVSKKLANLDNNAFFATKRKVRQATLDRIKLLEG